MPPASLVAAELATGTFYLLMLALGLAAGALAAHPGSARTAQIVSAALVGGARHRRAGTCKRAAASAVGAGGRATATSTSTSASACRSTPGAADGTARVQLPRRAMDGAPAAGRRPQRPASTDRGAVEGNWLVLAPAAALNSFAPFTSRRRPMEIALVIAVIAVIFIVRTFKIVPQQHAWVVERLGKYDRTLTPGLKFVVPFIERVAYKHSLKEVPLDVPSQVCITRDNTQLQVDGIIYFQVTDPMRASYGSQQLHRRDHAAGADHAAHRDRQDGARQDLRGARRDQRRGGRARSTRPRCNWGVKVLRYEIKDLTPPAAILHSMQAQITAEREKRALIAASRGPQTGADQHRHRRARGLHRPLRRPEARPRSTRRRARRRPSSPWPRPRAEAIRKIAAAIRSPGGEQAVQLKVAEKAVEAYAHLAQKNNTMIVPGNMSEVSALIGTAMTLMKSRPATGERTAALAKISTASGEVDERFKSHAWKACGG